MKYISSQKKQGIVIARFHFKEIDLEHREELQKELGKLLKADGGKFVLNLSEIGFLSSPVIATIAAFVKDVREKDGEVKLCELSKQALEIAQVIHLAQSFEVYNTEREAIESFGKVE